MIHHFIYTMYITVIINYYMGIIWEFSKLSFSGADALISIAIRLFPLSARISVSRPR